MGERSHHGPLSTAALISYGIVTLWALTVLGVFVLVFNRVPVEDVMVGILGAILSTTSGALTAVAGYWLASSANAERAKTSTTKIDTPPNSTTTTTELT